MKKLDGIRKKGYKTALGVLSGTSVDAVDIVLAGIRGSASSLKVDVIDYQEYTIPQRLRSFILENSAPGRGSVDNLCRMNFLLGNLYASIINRFLKDRNIKNKEIDFIGSHGQTVHHLPANDKLFGYSVKSTLQIGDPSVIANCTGILTVGDFRTADVAAGGGGAPLVPYLDFVLFRSGKKNRILLNIGGIANLTYLKKNCKLNDVVAFDTGPGNMMIDYIARKLFSRNYDRDCRLALKGMLNDALFCEIKRRDTYYNSKPPKSTGREFYGAAFVDGILKKFRKTKPEDVLRTFTFYTAFTISENIKKFVMPKGRFELLVSGGGSKNKIILSALESLIKTADVKILDENGIDSSNKEAVLFAVLANETLNGNPSNVISVTGAAKNVKLGKICLP